MPDIRHKTVSPYIAQPVSEWPVADPNSLSKGKDSASVWTFKEMCSIASKVSSKEAFQSCSIWLQRNWHSDVSSHVPVYHKRGSGSILLAHVEKSFLHLL